MKILIVDDEEKNLYLLNSMLSGDGYEVVEARNGFEALDVLRNESVELIISDILMPKMDGFQLCKECKNEDVLKNIPFIIYTATYTSKKDEDFALSLGADRFLIKPMEPELFIEIVSDVIKEYEASDPEIKRPTIKGDYSFLVEHNQRLINKLESKIVDMESEVAMRKTAEDMLRKLNEELENQVKEKTRDLLESIENARELERLANIGRGVMLAEQEIRNPLNIIAQATHVLESEGVLDLKIMDVIRNNIKKIREILQQLEKNGTVVVNG